MSSRKKGILLILLSVILFVSFMVWQKKEKKKPAESVKADIQTMAPVQESMLPVQNTMVPDAVTVSTPPETTQPPEEQEEEEAYPLVMDVSALPVKSLEEMEISQEDAARRIRIFANAHGYAGIDQVFYAGETRFDDNNQSVIMDLYFEPEGEEAFYFSFTYYKETKEYVLAPW
ncbi:MAG: hypothetical protein K2J67_10560 [Lachnospiraceae bacterium]|nr:hypothetical protein [Lachnospiraceae bacterium]